MLFDIRGRRKNAVRVVYAVLALLMGGSLFLTVGPFSIGELFDTGGSSNASEVFEEQVDRIEKRLAKNPQDEALLLALTRAQISAGNSQLEVSAEGAAEQEIPTAARKEYDRALITWNRYLKQVGDEANPAAAQLIAGTSFSVAERGSSSLVDIESNVATAAQAQRIAAEQTPNVGSLSALAIYEFFDGNYPAGDKATKQAVARAPSKAEAKSIEKQLDEFRQSAKQFQKRVEKFAKAQQKSGAGAEALQNPFGGVGSAGLGE